MSSGAPTLVQVHSLLKAQLNPVLPFLFALLMAWRDIKTHRIPNYLTYGCALAGLGYQLGFHGLTGLLEGFLGMALGLGLLIFFYVKGGMGAGDVKALAAMGAWLGPKATLYLFIYMGISGGLLAVIWLWWRGLLWGKIQQGWGYLLNLLLLRLHPSMPGSAAPQPAKAEIPYAAALAMGMAILCWRGFTSVP